MKYLILLLPLVLTAVAYAGVTVEQILSAKDAPQEMTYAKRGGRELHVYVYPPAREKDATDSARPAIVTIHGGGWANPGPEHMAHLCRYFASRGLVAVNVEYRLAEPNELRIPDCIRDVQAAVAFVRANAGTLGIDPNRIAVAGDSAGGHLAASVGILPDPNAVLPVEVVSESETRFLGTPVSFERLGQLAGALASLHPDQVFAVLPANDVPWPRVIEVFNVLVRAKAKAINFGKPGESAPTPNGSADATRVLADAMILYNPSVDVAGLKWIKGHVGVKATKDSPPGETWEDRARRVSPIEFIRPSLPPTLLIHGIDDGCVPIEHADRFAAAMKKANNRIEYKRMEGWNHAFVVPYYGTDRQIVEAIRMTDRFLIDLGWLTGEPTIELGSTPDEKHKKP